MADSKISALTELDAVPAIGDWFAFVDVSDTTMNASGTTKKIAADRFIYTNGTANTLAADINMGSNDIVNVGGIAIGTASTGQLIEMVGSLGGMALDTTGVTWSMTRASNNYMKASSAGGAIAFITNGASNSGANSSLFLGTVSQRVGVAGQSSPSYALDVNGAAHASSFPTSSDRRLKENLTPIKNSRNLLQKLRALTGYEFDWIDNYAARGSFVDKDEQGREKRDNQGRLKKHKQIGLVAQEVADQFPELVTTWRHTGQDGEVLDDAMAVDYSRIIPILIEVIKDLADDIDSLKQRGRP